MKMLLLIYSLFVLLREDATDNAAVVLVAAVTWVDVGAVELAKATEKLAKDTCQS